MTSKSKPSRSLSNRKRINLGSSAQPGLSPRGRKRETLQSFLQKRLQPWLDFANLLPADVDDSLRMGLLSTVESDRLHREFVQQFASQPKDDFNQGLRFFAQHLAPRNRRLEELFILVRDVMVHCVRWTRFDAMLLLPEEQELYSRDPNEFWASEYNDPVEFSVPYEVEIWRGRITSQPYLFINAFRELIEGLEFSRIRCCPIAECGKF